MAVPKNLKQSIKRTILRIILNSHNLIMLGSTRTHIAISRIMQQALSISDFSSGNTRHTLKCELHTPKATGSELGELLAGSGGVGVGSLSDGIGVKGGGIGGRARTEGELVEPAAHWGFVIESFWLGLVEEEWVFGRWFGEGEKR